MDPIAPSPTTQTALRQAAMKQAADALETAFLSEMLKGAGLGESPGAFGGGTGEGQFASLLRDEQARMMQQAGGIGLAEQLMRAMAGHADE